MMSLVIAATELFEIAACRAGTCWKDKFLNSKQKEMSSPSNICLVIA